VNNKSILIFGAGINQVELIREANKLGVISIVIDPTVNPPGKKEASFYYQVGGNDYKTTKEIAIKHSVDGIVTGQMEKPMRLMAKLANELDFIFPKPEIIEKSLNKALMKNAFISHKIPCARGKVFKKNELISKEISNDLNFPLIIKPIDAFSSRGVLRVNNYKEIGVFEEEVRSFSSDSSILVEEFLEGREFSIESITYKGKSTVIQVTEKFITPYPNTVEMAHLQPARISELEKREIESLVKNTINAIGINNSASHTEIMLTDKGSYVIEIGARLGGDFISSYLTKASTGISMDKATIQIALGFKPDLRPTSDKYSMIKYIKLEEGKRVKQINSLNDFEFIDGFVFSKVFVKQGDKITKLTHSAERDACVLCQSIEYNSLLKIIETAEKIIKSKILIK